ncbi:MULTISPECIES: DUF4138 domain-containing protein [Flavobacteriaceae]|uniref:DUF4138 domain-containing protein n=1 Tax=Flavobacteriaceae TaxID=49546 RepID=UPI001492AFD0|nr:MULTISPECIES: DUF4138 domain-containing protein [Allomuricauda]MDC6367206.1 DUF4138 domain-containing protein [Muricauda sp. AC10]
MNKLFLFISFFSLGLFAQQEKQAIEATTDKNVFLFFPSPISKALSGNGDFKFGYNTQTAEKFGVLKAVSSEGESTLHVITEDGTVYSFIVRYAPNPSQFEYFLDGSKAVGNLSDREANKGKNAVMAMDGTVNPEGVKITEDSYYKASKEQKNLELEFCKNLIDQEDYYKNIYRTKNNMLLKLSNIGYRNNKTFMVVTIENKSSVDYDLNFIQFNKIAKKASKKSNYQAIEIKSLEDSNYQTFDRIDAFSTRKAVYVFDKLSIDKNKLINIEINEMQGERNLELPIGYRIINNPNTNF